MYQLSVYDCIHRYQYDVMSAIAYPRPLEIFQISKQG